MKRFVAVVLAILYVLPCIGVLGVSSASDTDFVFQLSSDKDYYKLTGYTGTASKVSVPSSYNGLPVKSIYQTAFVKNSTITDITIPDSVTQLDYGTFAGCNNLKKVVLPSSLTSIPMGTFSSCTNLVEVTIPNSIKTIGANVFNGCKSLKSIELPNSVSEIGSDAFRGCENLTEVIFPNSVTKLGSYLFSGCEKLKSISLPNGITTIDYGTFGECKNLENVTIPNSVTKILQGAFYNCDSFTQISIPESVDLIEPQAFSGCDNVKTISVDSKNKNYKSYNNCLIETKTKSLIAGCQNSEIPSDGSVETIGEFAFFDLASLVEVSIPNSILKIELLAFSDCDNLKKVTISDSVTELGNSAFSSCYNLAELYIGNSVVKIGDSAFTWCTSLTSVEIPDSVISIGDYAFYNCENLENIIFSDSLTSIGNFAFEWCKKLSTVILPDSVVTIGQNAFSDCENLRGVSIPSSVTSIGKAAFGFSPNISISVSPANPIYKLVDDCLIDKKNKILLCGGANAIIPSDGSVKTIARDAFAKIHIEKVIIPDSVTTIEANAFSFCTSLNSVTLPNTITEIPVSAFIGCNLLREIEIPDSVTKIEAMAFAHCSLTHIEIPDSVTYIGEEAFYWNYNMTYATIPDSVTQIGFQAFSDCENLQDLYCESNSRPTAWNVDWTTSCYLNVKPTIHWNYKIATIEASTDNAITAGTDIYVNVVDDAKSQSILQTIKDSSIDTSNAILVNTSINNNGEEISPIGEIEVSIAVPKAIDASNAKVWHVTENGEVDDAGATYHNGALVFVTNGNLTRKSAVKINTYYMVAESVCSHDGGFERVAVSNPTCAEQGYTLYSCSKCNYSFTDNYIDALGHAYTENVTQRPSCTEDGAVTYTCKRCSYKYEQILGSRHNYVKSTTAPTCSEVGYDTNTCTVCRHRYINTFVDALGHNCIIKTYDDGSQKLYCTVCERVMDPNEDKLQLGDVNFDNKIDQYDYILVKRHYFSTRILLNTEKPFADVNRDGNVNQYDYILIKRHYFGTYFIGK